MPEFIKVPDYAASPRQAVFHQATADEKLYGGAAGGQLRREDSGNSCRSYHACT